MSDHASPLSRERQWRPTPEAYMRGFESKIAAMRANADRLQEGLRAANATAASEEGEVTVTVAPETLHGSGHR